MSYLQITGLSKAFGKKQVLDGLELEVRQGECLVVFGGSGAGKTTLLRHIAGLVQPDAGRILLAGHDAAGIAPQQRGVAMAFQNFALYPHMTAFENIASPLRARALPQSTVNAQVQEVAALLRIEHVLGQLPRQLSNGQRQRTALARSLVHRPPLLLLDDPLRNVDAQLRFEMRLQLPRLFKAFGSTVLYVTQDYREALALGERIAVLAQGRFLQIDSPAGIYHRPCNREVARLFGDPPINLFDVTPHDDGGSLAVRLAGHTLRLPGMPADRHAGLVGRSCVLGLRPEDLDLELSLDLGARPRPGALPVQLQAVMPVNVRSVALLQAGQGEGCISLLASRPWDDALPAQRGHGPGHVSVAPGRALFFDRASGARL